MKWLHFVVVPHSNSQEIFLAYVYLILFHFIEITFVVYSVICKCHSLLPTESPICDRGFLFISGTSKTMYKRQINSKFKK